MNKKMRLKVATRLKRARERMNRQGAHWVQGLFLWQDEGEVSYCLVGGLRVAPLPKSTPPAVLDRAANSVQLDEVYRLALIEVARELGIEHVRVGRLGELMDVPIDEVDEPYLWAIEAVLTSRNDSGLTTWEHIEGALLKAEERMRA